ncbi:uncharacterized protein LOC143029910 isoform X3 [Oratosquilla oratoria]|uniref:uncharacterized protein LOC143029910 isoform X3 n=1 Tax=Oratosquilla oratoria TaxID=337810 RepID=UPI003F76ABE2
MHFDCSGIIHCWESERIAGSEPTTYSLWMKEHPCPLPTAWIRSKTQHLQSRTQQLKMVYLHQFIIWQPSLIWEKKLLDYPNLNISKRQWSPDIISRLTVSSLVKNLHLPDPAPPSFLPRTPPPSDLTPLSHLTPP